MLKNKLHNLFYAFLLLHMFFNVAFAQNAEKVYKKVNAAVVKITSYRNNQLYGTGSGVIIKEKGWIITNCHVIGSANLVVAKRGVEFIDTDTVIAFDVNKDVFILRLSRKITKKQLKTIPNIKLQDNLKLRPGQRIYAIGSPAGFENTITEGIISGLRSSEDSTERTIQISAPISKGSSGGAVLDDKGRLIGISTSILQGPSVQNINFAIYTDDVLEVAKGILQPPANASEEQMKKYYLQKARTEFINRNYAAAIQHFKKVGSDYGTTRETFECFYSTGNAYKFLLQADSAEYYLKRALEVTNDAEAQCSLAQLYYEQGKINLAADWFAKATKLEPNYSDAYLGLGMCQFKNNAFKLAIYSLNKSLRNATGNPKTHYLIAQSYEALNNTKSAIFNYKEAIKFAPNYKEAYQDLISVYGRIGDFKNAEYYTEQLRLLK